MAVTPGQHVQLPNQPACVSPQPVWLQVQAQKDHIAEQNQRCKDLEASSRQLEERCSELKEAAAGHELRAKEAAAEVLKGNRIIEKVSVSSSSCRSSVEGQFHHRQSVSE